MKIDWNTALQAFDDDFEVLEGVAPGSGMR